MRKLWRQTRGSEPILPQYSKGTKKREGKTKGAAEGRSHRNAELTTTRTDHHPVILTLSLVYAPVLTPTEKISTSI